MNLDPNKRLSYHVELLHSFTCCNTSPLIFCYTALILSGPCKTMLTWLVYGQVMLIQTIDFFVIYVAINIDKVVVHHLLGPL
jgi:hypothetical protein